MFLAILIVSISCDCVPVASEEISVHRQWECCSIPIMAKNDGLRNDTEEFIFPEEDINLIALVTMAEAEGESEYGKRLVIDVILNRWKSDHYPNTIFEIVYQPNQFSSVWDGRIDECYVMNEICQLVKEELLEQKNYDVIFFTAGNYGKYGTPMFQEGNHYFSSYE